MTRKEIDELILWLDSRRSLLSLSAVRGIDKIMPELRRLRQNPPDTNPVPGTLLWQLCAWAKAERKRKK